MQSGRVITRPARARRCSKLAWQPPQQYVRSMRFNKPTLSVRGTRRRWKPVALTNTPDRLATGNDHLQMVGLTGISHLQPV
jgi:hypothetical protein